MRSNLIYFYYLEISHKLLGQTFGDTNPFNALKDISLEWVTVFLCSLSFLKRSTSEMLTDNFRDLRPRIVVHEQISIIAKTKSDQQ